MVNTITLIVKSALLVIGSHAAEPIPYCTLEMQGQEGYELFEDPEGGCAALGERWKASVQAQNPDSPVLLIVDGKTNQGM